MLVASGCRKWGQKNSLFNVFVSAASWLQVIFMLYYILSRSSGDEQNIRFKSGDLNQQLLFKIRNYTFTNFKTFNTPVLENTFTK